MKIDSTTRSIVICLLVLVTLIAGALFFLTGESSDVPGKATSAPKPPGQSGSE